MIKNKDGTEFTLGNKPNDYTLHNFEENMPKYKEVDIVISKIEEPTLDSNWITVNCLPVKTSLIKDELYGENIQQTKYAQPFKINILIAKSNDLILECWSKIKLEKSSIIHQPEIRRWWVINEIMENNDWNKYTCLPSTINPHFS